MKKRSSLFIFVLILIALFSCESKINHFNFENSYALKAKENQNNFFYKGGLLFLHDSILIVTSTPQTTQCIHLFNKNNFEYIKSVGNVGKGDREISMPGVPALNYRNGVLWYPDLAKKRILGFDIKKIIANNTDFSESYIQSPYNPFIGQYYCLNDSLFSFRHPSLDTLISFFNTNGMVLDSLAIGDKTHIYDYHKIDPRIFNSSTLYLYATSVDLTKVAIAYRYSDTFQILDGSGNVISTLKGPDNIHQIPEFGNLDQKITYKEVRSDDKYIYCLYSGEPLIIKKDQELIPTFAKQLRIFDWDGVPIANINFEKNVGSFVIDKQNNIIITFCPKTGNFVTYSLPDILSNED